MGFYMKRSFLAFILIFIFLFSACGETPADTTGADAPTSDEITVDEITTSNETSEKETGEVTEETKDSVTAPVPVEPEKRTTFLAAGDNIIYYGTVRDAQSMAVKGGRKYNFKPIYSNVADMIKNADVSFINQETLMCGEGYELTWYPQFNSPQELGHDLYELGFDVICIANNHMLDKGSKGLNRTIEFYDTLPVMMIGGYKNEEDYRNIRIYEQNGVKIAFLAYTEFTNLKATKGYDTYIPYLENADLEAEVKAARESADVVIASVHWGNENKMKYNDFQKEYAQKLADAGVDVILGHHPHVIQPVEWLEGKNGNKTLCYYSLGNFMAEQARDYNMLGGIVTFDIVTGGECDGAVIENALFTPTVFDFTRKFYNNKVYLLENYTAEQAKNHGIGYYGNSASLKKFREYVSNTVDTQFLPESYISSLEK